jgi:hypothetical protein
MQSGVVRPPWETALHGVVSLTAMLEFAAKDFVDISHRFGLVLGEAKRPTQSDPNILRNSVSTLLSHCGRLGLRVTVEQIVKFMEELARECPQCVQIDKDGVQIKGAQLATDRSVYYLEVIHSTFLAELATHTFKAISQEKARFCDPNWLMGTTLFTKYPDTVDEFQRAGRCFAYGENTACVFHLMRVTDFYLHKVGESIPGFTYDARGWDGLGKAIAKKMEEKYQTKTDEWKSKEPFYAEILTDIQAISRGHRNPALHELEKKYDEREAEYMLTVIEGFARHVAEKL